MRQEAMVWTVGGYSDPRVIGHGVRQGCPISPMWFSIYAEVKSFKNLGSVITEDGRSHSDVKVRIVMAKDAFNKRQSL